MLKSFALNVHGRPCSLKQVFLRRKYYDVILTSVTKTARTYWSQQELKASLILYIWPVQNTSWRLVTLVADAKHTHRRRDEYLLNIHLKSIDCSLERPYNLGSTAWTKKNKEIRRTWLVHGTWIQQHPLYASFSNWLRSFEGEYWTHVTADRKCNTAIECHAFLFWTRVFFDGFWAKRV